MTDKKLIARKFPSSFYNTISFFGVGLASASFVAILFLFIVDLTAQKPPPYLGILAYIVFPVFLFFGLILILFGLWHEHRRRLRTQTTKALLYIDLNLPDHRRAFIAFTIILMVFLLFTAVGSYRAFMFSESVTFCGTVCHKVMEPEYTTYQNSPHARVKCVECHVGKGAGWYVQSKLSGAYQVYSVLFNKYPRPIPTPISNLRPARETCEQCHWPQAFFGSKQVFRVHFIKDEKNTRWFYNLLIKIGGGTPELGHTSGIHWHMNISNKIEYLPADESREVIPWIRSTSPEGKVTTYTSDPSLMNNTNIEPDKIRVMDCMDCHNRPTHKFHLPNIALNTALNFGQIDAGLPFIKSVSVDTLISKYETKQEAMAAIASTIREFYAADYPELAEQKRQQINEAIRRVQEIYLKNNFPRMKASWRTYPDNIGHFSSPGCFRCHDGMHKSTEGKIITKKCNTCHLIIEQGDGQTVHETNLEGLEFRHPADIDNAWMEMSCHECHGLEVDM